MSERRVIEARGITRAYRMGRTEVETILADDQAAIRQITSQLEPSIREIIEGSRRKIEQVLTEEQMERWDELSTRRRRVFREEAGTDH